MDREPIYDRQIGDLQTRITQLGCKQTCARKNRPNECVAKKLVTKKLDLRELEKYVPQTGTTFSRESATTGKQKKTNGDKLLGRTYCKLVRLDKLGSKQIRHTMQLMRKPFLM